MHGTIIIIIKYLSIDWYFIELSKLLRILQSTFLVSSLSSYASYHTKIHKVYAIALLHSFNDTLEKIMLNFTPLIYCSRSAPTT